MPDLEALLADPDVEIVESTGAFSPSEVERVRDGDNRAVAGIVRDDERVLLVRRSEQGWRLPGTDVRHVVAFEQRLRESLHDRVGIESATVSPVRIHRHSAANVDDVPPYHYVLYDVEPEEPPSTEITDSPKASIEIRWFNDRPAEVLNPDVMDRLFADERGAE